MLYVVGESLPKTDFLTKVDVVIVLTTGSLLFIGIGSVALARVHSEYGVETANLANSIFGWALVVVNVIANIVVFLPAIIRQAPGASPRPCRRRRAPIARAHPSSSPARAQSKERREGLKPKAYDSPAEKATRTHSRYTPFASLILPKPVQKSPVGPAAMV